METVWNQIVKNSTAKERKKYNKLTYEKPTGSGFYY